MRILVCGSREYGDRDFLRSVLYGYLDGEIEIIQGGARGNVEVKEF